MNVTANQPTAGVGPALAMIDAVDNGRHGHIRVLAETFGPQALTDSVIELTRRLLVKAEIIDDYDSLIDLHAETHRRNLYHRLDIRLTDRLFPWTPPLMAARGFMCEMFSHYLTVAPNDYYYDDDEDDDYYDDDVQDIEPFTSQFVETIWIGAEGHILGLAYAATLLLAELAEYGDHDFDNMMAAYRAVAAEELTSAG